MLANQCGPLTRQSVAARLHRDSLSGAQTATSLLAATLSADARRTSWLAITRPPMQGRQAGLESAGC
jgi:hypothetical protein